MKTISHVCLVLPLFIAGIFSVQSSNADPIDFDRDIRPLLSDRCFICHGPDEEAREADLRFDDEASAKETAVVEGEPDESELIARIMSDDPDTIMPPPESKLRLTDDEKSRLKQWIAEGAKWSKHWSFQPLPETTAVPDASESSHASWVQSPIDAFVLAQMEAAGLAPSKKATREQLIRRVSFDVRGLPPTLKEIDEFLSDDSPDAYEQMVDTMLASKSFGERMTSDWLDVARYSDTYGYQQDRDRYVWPWRDWIIRAFNDNVPYDQFVTLQLAGDLIPNPTQDDILATTFNRLHPQKVEGGSVEEEFRIEYVVDRTQTFATAFLGLTMECCRCHDHKYDPLSQREFYELSAFFDNIDEAGLYSYFTNSIPTPTLRLPSDLQKKQLEELTTQIARQEQKLADTLAQQKSAFDKWLAEQSVADPKTGKSAKPLPIPGQIAHLDFESGIGGGNKQVDGRVGKAVKLSGDDAVNLKVGNFRRWQPFSVSLWMQTPDEKDRAIIFHRSRAWTDAASRGYQLMIEDGRLSFSLIHFWPGNALRVRAMEKLPTESWKHVSVTYDGSSRAGGVRMFLDGQPIQTEIVRDNLYKQIAGGGGDNIAIGERFRDRGFTNGLVDEFKVYERQLTAIEIEHEYHAKELSKTGDNDEQLLAYYLTTVNEPYQKQLEQLQSARKKRFQLQDKLTEIMVMAERPVRRTTYFLNRGSYDARGEAVSEGTPATLPEFGDLPKNRLGLSQWLTAPDHPLTARVAVNRLWQMLFSHGLVRTPEDFGTQGARPTHPELLDWLARDLVAGGWDIKRSIKQILMSATYQQSSLTSEKTRMDDPANKLLSHYPAHRLSAEMLRDNSLQLGNLLVNKIGGPPSKPYEVEVSFKPTRKDKGEGLYRRSVYTYWKRTGPAPALMTLDAAKRDVCRVKRERTSSPLQAFVLMNGPQFVEAARTLTQSLIQNHGDNTEAILIEMFRKMTSRNPSNEEVTVLAALFDAQRKHFANEPDEARKYLEVGESKVPEDIDKPTLAAMTSVANSLLVYDESMMKR